VLREHSTYFRTSVRDCVTCPMILSGGGGGGGGGSIVDADEKSF
jgi:hypothetical protein